MGRRKQGASWVACSRSPDQSETGHTAPMIPELRAWKCAREGWSLALVPKVQRAWGRGGARGMGRDGGGACLSGILGTKLCEGQAHCRRGCLAALLKEGALDRGGERFWVKRLAQDKPRGHQSGFIQQRGLWPHCWRKEFVTEPGGLRQAFGPGEGDDRGKNELCKSCPYWRNGEAGGSGALGRDHSQRAGAGVRVVRGLWAFILVMPNMQRELWTPPFSLESLSLRPASSTASSGTFHTLRVQVYASLPA